MSKPLRLQPIIRESTSQPTLHTSPRDFNLRYAATEKFLPEYDATVDPYCPYTHTERFRKHIQSQQKLNGNHVSKSQQFETISPSMKDMDRPTSAPKSEKQFTHEVRNENFHDAGITFSSEPRGNAAEGQAELEVLKSILSREGYLTRLFKVVRKVEKKFKPEIADILDLVRVSTVEVVNAIQKWRSIKVHFPALTLANEL